MPKCYAIFTALIIANSTALHAAPWDGASPAKIHPLHKDYAKDARRSQGSGAISKLKPSEIDWDIYNQRMIGLPVSNLSAPNLTKLLTGRYHLFARNALQPWSLRYYGPDGKTFFCENPDGYGYREWAFDRYIEGTAVGFAGLMHWDVDTTKVARPPETEQWGWPVVANSDTGEIAMFSFDTINWYSEIGWLQDEFPTDASLHCPNMPRSSKVNRDQSGSTLKELARNAKPVRGFTQAFKNDPYDPLTAGQYYYLYPPEP